MVMTDEIPRESIDACAASLMHITGENKRPYRTRLTKRMAVKVILFAEYVRALCVRYTGWSYFTELDFGRNSFVYKLN